MKHTKGNWEQSDNSQGDYQKDVKLRKSAKDMFNTLTDISKMLAGDIPEHKFILALLQIRRDVDKAIERAII